MKMLKGSHAIVGKTVQNIYYEHWTESGPPNESALLIFTDGSACLITAYGGSYCTAGQEIEMVNLSDFNLMEE